MRVLGEKAVARVNRIGACDLGCGKHAWDVEIAFCALGGTDTNRLVRKTYMKRMRIGLRVDGHRGDAELLARGNDAERNLSAIGDEDFLEHDGVAGRRRPYRARG